MSKFYLLLICVALSGRAATAQEFVAVPQSGGPGVWIIDTETGEAKFCGPKSLGPGTYAIECIKEGE